MGGGLLAKHVLTAFNQLEDVSSVKAQPPSKDALPLDIHVIIKRAVGNAPGQVTIGNASIPKNGGSDSDSMHEQTANMMNGSQSMANPNMANQNGVMQNMGNMANNQRMVDPNNPSMGNMVDPNMASPNNGNMANPQLNGMNEGSDMVDSRDGQPSGLFGPKVNPDQRSMGELSLAIAELRPAIHSVRHHRRSPDRQRGTSLMNEFL
mmetsp:Transcript_31947/g.62832  ORF Transcript_31947/g.62832 Transcript_31947/m.62832 type:complete len:207 (+) Transcript_31947:63-683(+)